jgi:hypothetical protein
MTDGLNREGFTGRDAGREVDLLTDDGRDYAAEHDHAEFTGWMEAQGYNSREHFDEDFMAEAFTAGMQAARDYAAEAGPQPAPDLGAAYADLESEIREVTVQIAQCRSGGLACRFCEGQIAHAMKAVDAYARDVAQHERTRDSVADHPDDCRGTCCEDARHEAEAQANADSETDR